MNSKPEISIIVPVYGVENHIAKCVESIRAQTFKSFEAIFIDDGSRDSSIAKAKEAIAGDERFFIYHKENGGQGSARNLGLDKARGNYIAFIDSDDWVAPNFLKAMYEKIVAENAEICTCNSLMVFEDGRVIKSISNDLESYFAKNDVLLMQFTISNFMWDKLFTKSCFDGFRFDETLKSNEDVHLLFRVIYGRKLTSINQKLYFYVQRKKSTSKEVGRRFIEDRLQIFNMHEEFLGSVDPNNNYSDMLNYSYLVTFIYASALTINLYSNKPIKDIKNLISRVDGKRFSFKNICRVICLNKKAGLSLLALKLSPLMLKFICNFWFRNRYY